jgi:uncharacterized protein YbjT (DUF2867 family)
VPTDSRRAIPDYNGSDKPGESNVKIVIIGGTGLIGSKVVEELRGLGHEAVPAAPNTGVNTITGEGLAEVMRGADVVVDVSNSPSFEDAAVMEFFVTSTRNILEAESAAGVRHHVALSIVGSGRLPYSGYMRAKVAQEKLIESSPIPYSIVHATQFFEFVMRIADAATEGDTVRIPPVRFQPMAADDVAHAVTRVAVGVPLDGIVEVAGPEVFRFDEVVRRVLAAHDDPRKVVADPQASYYGTLLAERSLIPGDGARLGKTTILEWLDRGSAARAAAGEQRSARSASSDSASAGGTVAPASTTAPSSGQVSSLSVAMMDEEIASRSQILQASAPPEWATEPGAVLGMRLRRPAM